MGQGRFDELAKGLASGTISPRRALKLTGSALLGSTGLLSLFPDAARASELDVLERWWWSRTPTRGAGLDVFTNGRQAATSRQLLELSGHQVVLPGAGGMVKRVGFKIAL